MAVEGVAGDPSESEPYPGVRLDLPWKPPAYLIAFGYPLFAAAAYYAGAMLAFLVGTLSDHFFAPFWPPNVILFYVLTVVPPRRWPLYLAAVFPAHVLAELWVEMPAAQMLVAYATNCAVAILAALAFGYLRPPQFANMPARLIRIALIAAIAPALVAFGGAFVPIVGGEPTSNYWSFWGHWYVGNALAFLTLGPVLVTWLDPRRLELPPWPRLVEAVLVGVALLLACAASLRLAPSVESTGFLPAVLYLPLPFILWAAVRFGEAGASAAVFIVASASTWSALKGPSPFFAGDPESTVLALQLYLIGTAIAVLSLGASIDELHVAERRTRWLARALLEARDEERRRIARDLHDSTGQNLVAASMIADQIAEDVPECASFKFGKLRDSIQQSIREVRTLSYLLHPPLLDEGGLKLALENFVDGYTQRSGIKVHLDIEPDLGRLPRTTELVLFRVVQEALTNVGRHSGSATATISIVRDGTDQTTELIVEDFGKGFPGVADTFHLDHVTAGIGLSSMQERLLQIGGRLDIQSRVGRTVVRATVPP